MASTSIDIANSLGLGTGINTTQLVSDLVSATFTPREDLVNSQITTNNARISAVASIKNALQTFSDALTQTVRSADYAGQPASNNTTIATVSALEGGTPQGLPAQLEVQQLAQAQVLQSTTLSDATQTAGIGTLTITVGSTSTNVVLADGSNSLANLASAINNAKTGVTASIVTDQSGSRLVLKGATGAANSFTVTAGADADANLTRFTQDATSGTLSQTQAAKNSKIVLDNVALEYATNTVTTAIPYLRIDLNSASVGTKVTLATNQPTASVTQLVQDFVTQYNNLHNQLASATQGSNASSIATTGVLGSDYGIRDLSNRLSRLIGQTLSSDGPYKTLTDIGVTTNQDGTIAVDSTRLNAAVAANKDAVSQLLIPTVTDSSHIGIANALKSITDLVNGDGGALSTSTTTYTNLQSTLQKQLDDLDQKALAYKDRLTTVYAGLQSRLTALQATQSYIDQQFGNNNNSN